MEFERLIGLVFTGFFVIILFYIILRSLLLMSKDMGEDPLAQKTLRLEVVQKGENYALKEGGMFHLKEETTFGRKEENTVVLEDPYVSGTHFSIFPHEGRFVLEDKGSTNGTLLNGKKLTQKTYLKKNDVIKVGNLALKVKGS
ncbi:MAG TPA: hypothetical protein DEA52_00695 [Clostridiaceae bacterium]|nr:hypothetical protein [Clostridiaceae bacterium]